MTSYTVPHGGERLDRIAKKLMQTERQGTVEAILAANPGLAALSSSGAMVPEGTVIQVPADYRPAPAQTFTLAWE